MDAKACIGVGDESNHTTAAAKTRSDDRIVASFWSERPPVPSRLSVSCPDLDPQVISEPPRILRMVEGVILFSVATRCRRSWLGHKEYYDYFIYHVDDAKLQRIPHPSPITLRDDDVGLLPRGSNLFTVAALAATHYSKHCVFTLHLLHSEIGKWASFEVTLAEPQGKFPVEIPREASRLRTHITSTVITLGGEGGTMGWVDLWRGILLCDVLSANPQLRGVPVPLPMMFSVPDREIKIDPICPKPYRGIAFIKEKRCLRFVDLDVTYRRVHCPGPPGIEEVPDFRFDAWMITTWTNSNLSGSYEDWSMVCDTVHGDSIKLGAQARETQLVSQLLLPDALPQDNSVATRPEQILKNFWVTRPTPSMDGSNVVFVIARPGFRHSQAYALAIDMRNGELQSVAEFGAGWRPGATIMCCHGSVSKRT